MWFALGILLKFVDGCHFEYCSNISPFLRGVSSRDVDVDWNGRIWFGGLIIGRRLSAMDVGLIGSRHRWSRRCWRGCLRGLGWAETFLPDQHADQEEGQGDTDHGSRWGERPMSLCQFDLVEFLEQLAGVEFSVVLGPESLNRLVDAFGVGPAEKVRQFAGSRWSPIRLLRSRDP